MTTFATALDAAIDDAPVSANHLADLSRRIWQAWSSGTLTDAEAQDAATRIADRQRQKGGMRSIGEGRNNAPASFSVARLSFPRRKNQRSPDRQRSIERRRRWAASGRLAPSIAQHFTQAEQAAIAVVLSEIKKHGVCGLVLDAISAIAGCCRTTTRNACRKAASLGLLLIRERRRAGQKSLSNIVTCISDQVRRWLRMPDKGSRKLPQSTDLKTGIRGAQSFAPYPSARVG